MLGNEAMIGRVTPDDSMKVCKNMCVSTATYSGKTRVQTLEKASAGMKMNVAGCMGMHVMCGPRRTALLRRHSLGAVIAKRHREAMDWGRGRPPLQPGAHPPPLVRPSQRIYYWRLWAVLGGPSSCGDAKSAPPVKVV